MTDPMLDGIQRGRLSTEKSGRTIAYIVDDPEGDLVAYADLPALIARVREDEQAKAREEGERERRRVEGPLDAYWNNVLRIKIADAYAKGRADALREARDAVAALRKAEATFYVLEVQNAYDMAVLDALAAIDALRGGTDE